MRAVFALTAFAALAASFALTMNACSGSSGTGGADGCVEDLSASCAPLYTPTFDEIFTRTLKPTCSVSNAACHAAAGAQGGLTFEDADASYALLLGKTDGKARVVPGDPS